MITISSKNFLSEIKEIWNNETIFNEENKTLEYEIKCMTKDGRLKLVRFLTHADKILTSKDIEGYKMVLFQPLYEPLLKSGIAYGVEDYVEKMTLEQVEEILGYKIEIVDKN